MTQSLLLRLAFSSALSLLPALAASADDRRFVAVVDAGSSGSRLSLYALSSGRSDLAVEDLLEVGNAPALSSFSSDPQQAGPRAMGNLIASLNARLAELKLSKDKVEIHVLGTAGMRLVDVQKAGAIYDSVAGSFKDAGYAPRRIGTIGGDWEGFYAWADVNYLNGSLAKGSKPVGTIEIGGASAQVTFAVETTNEADVIRARILGRDHVVKSVSFLGLGVNEARRSMMAGADKGASCYPSESPAETVIAARFDMQACTQTYAAIIADKGVSALSSRADWRGRSFIGVGRPMAGSLALWKMSEPLPAKLGAKAAQECTRGWAHIAATYGVSRLTQDLCANSVFMQAFLDGPSGLRLPDEAIVAQERVGGRVPNWPRGVAVSLAAD